MRALVLFATLWAFSNAQGQTVYRCGPDGRVYSQTPCAQGKAVDVSDERSPAQRAAAEARVREDQARGDSLERERLDREAGKPPRATSFNARPAPAEPPASAAKAAKKKKPRKAKHEPRREGDDFKAVAPPPPKKPRKPA